MINNNIYVLVSQKSKENRNGRYHIRKLKKKTRELSRTALGLSFYLQKLYKINNVSYIVTLKVIEERFLKAVSSLSSL